MNIEKPDPDPLRLKKQILLPHVFTSTFDLIPMPSFYQTLWQTENDIYFAIINVPQFDNNIPKASAYVGWFIFHNVTIFWVSVSSYLQNVLEDINTLLKSIPSLVFIWREIVLTVRSWFKVDHFPYRILRWSCVVSYI